MTCLLMGYGNGELIGSKQFKMQRGDGCDSFEITIRRPQRQAMLKRRGRDEQIGQWNSASVV